MNEDCVFYDGGRRKGERCICLIEELCIDDFANCGGRCAFFKDKKKYYISRRKETLNFCMKRGAAL